MLGVVALTAEDTEVFTHQVVTVVMMRDSIFLLLVLFGTFMNVMFTREHGKFTC